MAGRIGDATGTFIGVALVGNQVLLTCVTAAVFIFAMILLFRMYQDFYMPFPAEKENSADLLSNFESRYELSARETDVFRSSSAGAPIPNSEITFDLHSRESC